MNVRDKVYNAAEQLIKTAPYDKITFAEVAKVADVHWTAVRRHFGNKQKMRDWFKRQQMELNSDLADTKSRILESAAHVFSVQGYMNSSLDKVAEHAGLSKGAVYWHFSSKQDLFLAIVERHYEQQISYLADQVKSVVSAEDPVSALASWIESQLLCLQSSEANSILFLEFLVSGRETEIRDRLQSLHRRMMDLVAELVHEMQRQGFLAPDIDPYSLAVMLDALLKGVLVEWVLDPRPELLKVLVQTISRMLWQGIAGNS